MKGAKAAIDCYSRAFRTFEAYRAFGADAEHIMHARFRVHGFAILLCDDFPEFRGGAEAPPPSGATIHLEVDNADAWWTRAADAGATIVTPLADQFWGDRYGQVKDRFGHSWSIGAPIKK